MPNPLVLLKSKFFLFSLICIILPFIYLLLRWLVPIVLKVKKKENVLYNKFTDELNVNDGAIDDTKQTTTKSDKGNDVKTTNRTTKNSRRNKFNTNKKG